MTAFRGPTRLDCGCWGICGGLCASARRPWRSPIGPDDLPAEERGTNLTAPETIEVAIEKLKRRAEHALDNNELAEHDLYQLAIEHLYEALTTVERARTARSKEQP